MKTKRNIVNLTLVTCIVVLFASGCFTIPGKVVIDPDLPKENTALVIISEAIRVIEYNGIDVTKTWYSNNNPRVNKVTLPAGEATLFFNIRAVFARGNTEMTINLENLETTYDFEAGKDYTIGVYASQNIGTFFNPKQTLILAIWDKAISNANPGNTQNDRILKSWELGEF